MQQFQIQLDEVVCQRLAYIAEVTDQSIEDVISNGIYQQVANFEENIFKTFTYRE